MPDLKKIQLKRYADGTPSVLRKSTVYTELHFYRKSDVLVQLTKVFCSRFLPKYGDRTVDQMVQAARSVKQNIVEGLTDGQTSIEVEIKLLGIAKGSNQELLEDYKDYMKQHSIGEWAVMNVSRFDRLRQFCKDNSDESAYRPFYNKWSDEEIANTALCLCHMVDRAMTTFLEKRDREFVLEGGVRERMSVARNTHKQSQNEIIASQKREIDRLQSEVERLTRELENFKR